MQDGGVLVQEEHGQAHTGGVRGRSRRPRRLERVGARTQLEMESERWRGMRPRENPDGCTLQEMGSWAEVLCSGLYLKGPAPRGAGTLGRKSQTQHQLGSF